MRIRGFEGKDLNQVLDLLDSAMPRDRLSPEIFRYKVILQENFDPGLCLVAEEETEKVGFIFAPVRGDTGYLNIIAVEPGHQKKGIGTALLQEIEKRHKERGVKRSVFSGGPRYVVPGVDIEAYPGAVGFFLKNHFKEVNRDSVSMSRSLMNYNTPQQVLELENELVKEGYGFQQLDESHVIDLLLFLRRNFPGWDEDARKTLERYPDHLDWFIVALKDEQILGYCQVATDGLIEHFGPFGVASELRSKGIGAVIFHKCLRMIQSRGAKNVWFAWGGGRNYSFYVRHGMTETRRFAIFSKEI